MKGSPLLISPYFTDFANCCVRVEPFYQRFHYSWRVEVQIFINTGKRNRVIKRYSWFEQLPFLLGIILPFECTSSISQLSTSPMDSSPHQGHVVNWINVDSGNCSLRICSSKISHSRRSWKSWISKEFIWTWRFTNPHPYREWSKHICTLLICPNLVHGSTEAD